MSKSPTKILVVDDSEPNRYVMVRTLQKAGIQVTEAATGEEALRRVKSDHPDLVMLDINLPGINGYEVCRQIKEDASAGFIPVLQTSATLIESENKARGLEGGADGYLAHPIEPTTLFATIHSLLRMRRAEEEARNAAQQWQATFDAIRDGVCVLDDEDCILRCNLAMQELAAKPAQELLGCPYAEEARKIVPTFSMSAFAQPLRAGRRHTEELQSEKGAFSLAADPLFDEHGDYNGAVLTLSDITERRRLEQRLHQSQKMESIGRLAGGIAHDFNNLLAIIGGYAEMLETELEAESQLTSVHNIQQAAARAANLTQQLLTFARRRANVSKTIDLNELILETDKMLRRLIGEDIEMVTLPEAGLGAIKADPGQITQVLVNLILNARDAMPHGGSISISTADVLLEEEFSHRYTEMSPGAYVLLTVQDTGTGMTEEALNHLFEPFFTTKEKGKGTGLGLATSYGIVRQTGGHILVDSEPGKETSLRLYFPRSEESAPAPQSTERKPLPTGTETILLAEDEPQVRALAVRVLRGLGYTLLEAGSGNEGVQKALAYADEIHLLLTDVVMPQGGGRELAEQLTLLRPGIKVLYVSGYTDNVFTDVGLSEKDFAFLPKPYTSDILARKVRDVLDAERQAKAIP